MNVFQRGLMCGKSSPRVIKTIRLRRPGLLPWILDTEVRIVHLVRDPRAIITSVAKVSNQLDIRILTNNSLLFSETRHLE